jgi:hypothetical protein
LRRIFAFSALMGSAFQFSSGLLLVETFAWLVAVADL